MSIESQEVAEDLEQDKNQMKTHAQILEEYTQRIEYFNQSY